MDWFISSSTWVEGHSGQIQIVIGVVALFFAIIGYKAVLKQIKISNDQEKRSLELRCFEIRQAVLKTRMDYTALSFNLDVMRSDIQEILIKKISTSNSLNNIERYKEIQKKLNEGGEKESSANEIIDVILTIFEKDDFDIKFLESQYLQYLKIYNKSLETSNTLVKLKSNLK